MSSCSRDRHHWFDLGFLYYKFYKVYMYSHNRLVAIHKLPLWVIDVEKKMDTHPSYIKLIHEPLDQVTSCIINAMLHLCNNFAEVTDPFISVLQYNNAKLCFVLEIHLSAFWKSCIRFSWNFWGITITITRAFCTMDKI